MDFSIIFGGYPGINIREIIKRYSDKFYELYETKTIVGYKTYSTYKKDKLYNLQIWEVEFDKKNENRIKMLSKISNGCVILSPYENKSEIRDDLLKWKDMIKKESELVKREISFIFFEKKSESESFNIYGSSKQKSDVEYFARKNGFIKGSIFDFWNGISLEDLIKDMIDNNKLKKNNIFDNDEHDENDENEEDVFSLDSEGNNYGIGGNKGDFTLEIEIEKIKKEKNKYYLYQNNYYDLREKYKVLKSLNLDEFIKVFELAKRYNKINYKLIKKHMIYQVKFSIYNLFGKKENIILNFVNKEIIEDDLIKSLIQMKKERKNLDKKIKRKEEYLEKIKIELDEVKKLKNKNNEKNEKKEDQK